MKALTTNGLTKLIQLIKSSFISNTDTVTTNTVTLATVATSGSYNDLINQPDVSNFVTKTNNETIGGNKSFTGSTTFNESTFEGDVTFASGTITDFTGVYVSLGSGATADTPSTSDNSYAVATTEFVKNQGYVTSSAIQTQLDGKADTDLSNLTATSSANFDGQWVKSNLTIASQATAPKTTAIEYNLSSYLPNDNYNYEVFFSGNNYSASTSGSEVALILGSSALSSYVYVCRGRTTSNIDIRTAGNAIIPIPVSNRKIIVTPYANNSGTFTLAALGYRRIGTNS